MPPGHAQPAGHYVRQAIRVTGNGGFDATVQNRRIGVLQCHMLPCESFAPYPEQTVQRASSQGTFTRRMMRRCGRATHSLPRVSVFGKADNIATAMRRRPTPPAPYRPPA